MTPLMGFAPDMETPTPGVLVDCENFIPYESGMEAAPSAVTPSDVPALAAACLGAASISKIDGTKRVFAGTGTKLYELTGGRVGGSLCLYVLRGRRYTLVICPIW